MGFWPSFGFLNFLLFFFVLRFPVPSLFTVILSPQWRGFHGAPPHVLWLDFRKSGPSFWFLSFFFSGFLVPRFLVPSLFSDISSSMWGGIMGHRPTRCSYVSAIPEKIFPPPPSPINKALYPNLFSSPNQLVVTAEMSTPYPPPPPPPVLEKASSSLHHYHHQSHFLLVFVLFFSLCTLFIRSLEIFCSLPLFRGIVKK